MCNIACKTGLTCKFTNASLEHVASSLTRWLHIPSVMSHVNNLVTEDLKQLIPNS